MMTTHMQTRLYVPEDAISLKRNRILTREQEIPFFG